MNNIKNTKFNMKLIIANRGAHDIGKTTSIRNAFNVLQAKYPTTTTVYEPAGVTSFPIVSGEVKATIKIGTTLVGIETQGDPGSRMQQSVADYIAWGCEIILVACRNQGDTINTITNLANNHGYTVLWLQNGKCTDTACWQRLEKNYGDWVADVIEKCIKNGGLTPACL